MRTCGATVVVVVVTCSIHIDDPGCFSQIQLFIHGRCDAQSHGDALQQIQNDVIRSFYPTPYRAMTGPNVISDLTAPQLPLRVASTQLHPVMLLQIHYYRTLSCKYPLHGCVTTTCVGSVGDVCLRGVTVT